MKKILFVFIFFILIAIITTIIINSNNKNNDNIQKIENISNNTVENEINESEKIMDTTIKISIENKIYNATLEQNETAKQFINMLPQEFNMAELNGNEKYVYLDVELPTKTYNPKHIDAGDIMLYGNNCLVVFYKSFDTPYSYTKIGHIESLEDLENKNVTIRFEK